MKMINEEFEKSINKAKKGEDYIKDIFLQLGFIVIPHSGYSEKYSCYLYIGDNHYALPDLYVKKGNEGYQIEVKEIVNKTNEEYKDFTSLKKDLADDYKVVQKELNNTVFIIYIDNIRKRIYGNILDKLILEKEKKNNEYFNNRYPDDFILNEEYDKNKITNEIKKGFNRVFNEGFNKNKKHQT